MTQRIGLVGLVSPALAGRGRTRRPMRQGHPIRRAVLTGTIALGLLPAPGRCQTAAPEIVRGLCQKDGCAEFTIAEKTPVASGADGQLFRTRVSLFHASSAGRASTGEENGYVFCSSSRPAVISTRPGQPVTAFLLAPDEQAPAWQQRSSVNFFAIYFALCHGAEAGRQAALDRQATARSFGYHVPLTASRQMTLQRPEDILKPAP